MLELVEVLLTIGVARQAVHPAYFGIAATNLVIHVDRWRTYLLKDGIDIVLGVLEGPVLVNLEDRNF